MRAIYRGPSAAILHLAARLARANQRVAPQARAPRGYQRALGRRSGLTG